MQTALCELFRHYVNNNDVWFFGEKTNVVIIVLSQKIHWALAKLEFLEHHCRGIVKQKLEL